MADETNTVQFKLDLDAKDFVESVKKANDSLDKIGSDAHKTQLATTFTAFNAAAHLAVEVLHKVGEAAEWVFDKILEAEHIAAINYQFEQLSKNAGLSAESLKEGFEKASGGMTDINSIIERANQSLVNLGVGAERLPKLFEVARKSAALTGGTAIDRFDQLSKAIEFGNQKMLRQAGILINLEKAYKDYAASIGVGVKTLSDIEKQQALFNAVLEFGDKKLKSTPATLIPVTKAWKVLKTELIEFGETLADVFNRAYGIYFKKIIEMTSEAAHSIKIFLQDHLGKGSEQAAAHMERLKNRIWSLKEDIEKLQKNPETMSPFSSAHYDLDKYQEKLIELREELKKLQETHGEKKEEESTKPVSQEDTQKNELRLKADREYQKEKLAIEQQILADRENSAMTDEQVDANLADKKRLIAEQHMIHLQEIDANEVLNDKQKDDLKLQSSMETAEKLKAIDNDTDNDTSEEKIKAMERQSKASDSAFDRMANGAKISSRKSQIEFLNFEKTGEFVFKTFSNKAADAFVKLGEGTEDAGDLMKGFMFGALADIAQAQGAMLLASVLVNPMNGAAGAALLVLSGVLRSMSGASKSAVSIPSGGTSDYQSASAYESTSTNSEAIKQEEQKKKSVTIQVMGNYFETEETKRQLTEMIRSYQDATDFRFVQIGQT